MPCFPEALARWQSCKCFRLNFSMIWTSLANIRMLSKSCAQRLIWLCALQKTTAKAISKTKASLVVLECHLWLNLAEIRNTEKMAFLDCLDLPKGLFGPAVNGFV